MTENGDTEPTRVLFCGDRQVGAKIVGHINAEGGRVVAVGLNDPPRPGTREVRDAAGVANDMVFRGRSFTSELMCRRLVAAEPDLGVCCGFGPILPPEVLALPRWGWVNVHRSYLPFNRGLDPLQWAVVDGTPAGVSIHVMTEEVDAGPVVIQEEMPVLPTDNGEALEARADRLAFELFVRAWPDLCRGDVVGKPQEHDLATYHSWSDCEALRRLDRSATMKVGRVVDILRVYSGASGSAAWYAGGLLRARFSVRAEVRMVEQPDPEP